jgi:hypothetical protein
MDTESGSLFNFILVFRFFSKKFQIQLCPPGNHDLTFDERHFLIGYTTVHYLLPELETIQINAFKSILADGFNVLNSMPVYNHEEGCNRALITALYSNLPFAKCRSLECTASQNIRYSTGTLFLARTF